MINNRNKRWHAANQHHHHHQQPETLQRESNVMCWTESDREYKNRCFIISLETERVRHSPESNRQHIFSLEISIIPNR